MDKDSLDQVLVDPIIEYPYLPDALPKSLKLPENLKLEGMSGFAYVNYIINTKGKIENFNLIMLKLKNRKGEYFINFKDLFPLNNPVKRNYYPLPIRVYYDFFEKKLNKNEYFKENEGVKKVKFNLSFKVQLR